MKLKVNNMALARRINILALLGLEFLLCLGFTIQFFSNEKPCSLCFLQRVGLGVVIAAGFLNLRFGIRLVHYGLALLGVLVGAAASVRQIFLYADPLSGKTVRVFGPTVFGLSLYQGALLVFIACGVGIGGLLFLHRKAPTENEKSGDSRLERAAIRMAGWVAFGHVGLSAYYCRWGFCS